MTRLSERPFFVVGNPRSGTTLLRFILSSHPRLYIPSETGFIPFLEVDHTAHLSLDETRVVLDRIGSLNREWSDLVDEVPAFYGTLTEPTLAHVLDRLYHKQIIEQGAVRWGDKTPSYVRYLPTLFDIFPSAQFVHVIRDGRDAALSAQKKWGNRRWYMDMYYLLRNWVRHVERGRAAGLAMPADAYLEVRYEDLVKDPEAVVQQICHFLGEEFMPDLLDHTRLARKQIGPAGHVEVRQPISTTSAQRWRTEMSEFEKRMADRVAGSTLSALGYELAGLGPLSRTESTRLLLLSAKYAGTQIARQGLARAGLLTLNRGKRAR